MRTQVRIAVVHSFYSSREPSGENLVVEQEARALSRAGHEVAVFASRTDELEGSPFYASRAFLRVATGFGASLNTRIKSFGPDLVHIHNLFPNIAQRSVGSIRVPLVVTLHNFRPLCANALLLREGRVCQLCTGGNPLPAVRFACYRDSRLATLPLAVSMAGGLARNPLLRAASRIIVLSETARRIYVDAGMRSEKLVVWSNFLERGETPTTQLRRDANAPWLFVGRLGQEKGIAKLVERWPQHIPLDVVGDGADLTLLHHLATGKDVRLIGSLPRADVFLRMQRSRGLIFPSVCLESSPMVYAEAMAAALPVLAWRPNVLADRVLKDGTGTAVTWDEDLTEVLDMADRNFDGLRRRCLDVFRRDLTERAFVARAETLYGEVLSSANTAKTTPL